MAHVIELCMHTVLMNKFSGRAGLSTPVALDKTKVWDPMTPYIGNMLPIYIGPVHIVQKVCDRNFTKDKLVVSVCITADYEVFILF